MQTFGCSQNSNKVDAACILSAFVEEWALRAALVYHFADITPRVPFFFFFWGKSYNRTCIRTKRSRYLEFTISPTENYIIFPCLVPFWKLFFKPLPQKEIENDKRALKKKNHEWDVKKRREREGDNVFQEISQAQRWVIIWEHFLSMVSCLTNTRFEISYIILCNIGLILFFPYHDGVRSVLFLHVVSL